MRLESGILEELVHPLHLLRDGSPVAGHPEWAAHVRQAVLVVGLGVKQAPVGKFCRFELHLIFSKWDTVDFFISMSQEISPNFDINVPTPVPPC